MKSKELRMAVLAAALTGTMASPAMALSVVAIPEPSGLAVFAVALAVAAVTVRLWRRR